MHQGFPKPAFKELWLKGSAQRELADFILQEGAKRDLSDKELSRLLKVSRRELERLQLADANPKLSAISRIAHALGYCVHLSFTPAGKENPK